MSPSNTVPGLASTSLPASTPSLWIHPNETVPAKGALTWSAEGVSDPTSRYYSRKAHIPSPSSGITIGRGYDLKQHSESEILRDFTAAGLTQEQAALFASARSLSGLAAHTFIETSGLPEISASEEEALFQISWASALKDVQRISALPLVVQAYGAIDWSTINPAIRDLLVDLRYRGDYTPQTRALVQSAAANNDLQSLSEVLSNRQLWLQVPRDRFERRSQVAAAARESQASGM